MSAFALPASSGPNEVPWIGAIPMRWTTKRFRWLFREVDERSAQGKETHLSMTQGRGLVPSASLAGKRLHSTSYAGGKLVSCGDLVLNRLKAHLGVFSVAPCNGVVSPDYTVLRNRSEESTEYFARLLRSPAAIAELRRRTRGIVEGFWRLYTDDLYSLPLCIPPRNEQDQIVAFLRAQDVKLGRLVRAKQQLRSIAMERAHDQWHRLLSGAGASDCPLAYEWPPNTGSRWPLKRLKYLARQITDQCATQAEDESYVALEHVESWTGSLAVPPGPVAFASTVKRFAQDDILFGKLRPYLAKVARPAFKGVCVSEFIVLRARTEVMEPAFLEAVLRSKALIDRVAASSAGAKMPRTDWSVVGNLLIPVPPLDEQRQILASWNVLQKQSLALANQAKQDLNLALEYRTRLIADVVTGQHDVRRWRPGPDDVVDDAGASVDWGLLSGAAAGDSDDDHSLQGAAGDDEPDGHE